MEYTLNKSRLGFIIAFIGMACAGFWFGNQWTPAGFTLAGRHSVTAALLISFVGGIVIPMMFPQVRGYVHGSLLAGLGIGMILGMFAPGIIANIPPDVLASLTSHFVFGEDWGLGPVVTILLFLGFLGVTFFLGIGLRRVSQSLWDWLNNNPNGGLSSADSLPNQKD